MTEQAIERRSFEIRMAEDDKGAYIEGMLVPYDRWTDIRGGAFRERFERGAFREYLAGDSDVLYNYGHNRANILGRRSSGTLVVTERDDGVYGRVSLPDTSLGRDIRVMVQRGDIRGHSVEFSLVTERWELIDGKESRTVVKARMPGVALVADPAYKDTTAALRSLEAWREEQAARDAGRARTRAAEARLRLARLD